LVGSSSSNKSGFGQNLAQAHSHLPAAAEGTDEAIAIRWLKSISGNIFSICASNP